jgi:hypothetical protein
MSNTGLRLQIAPDLHLITASIPTCDLTGITILLGNAADVVTNKDCPSFIQLMDHDCVLQMIYDNGNLTLDDKSNGGLYEIETILDEITEWFGDNANIVSAVLGHSSHEEMGVNIKDDGLTAGQVSELMSDVVHYIKSEINITDLPLCHVDCLKGQW